MRRRILLTFLLGSVALALFLALTTYGLTKSNVIQQRIDSSVRTSSSNAQDVGRELRSNPASTAERTGLARRRRRAATT